MKTIKLIATLFMLVAFFSGNAFASASNNQLLAKTISKAIQANNLIDVIKQELANGTDLTQILDSLALLDNKDSNAKMTISKSGWNTVIKTALESGISIKEIFNAAQRVDIEPMFIVKRLLNVKIPATVVFASLEQLNIYSDSKEALEAFNNAMAEQSRPALTMDDVKNADQDALGYTPPGLDKNPAASKVARVVLPPAAASSNPNAGSFASPSTF